MKKNKNILPFSYDSARIGLLTYFAVYPRERVNIDGHYRDYQGNPLPSGKVPDAHIPIDKTIFIRKPWN